MIAIYEANTLLARINPLFMNPADVAPLISDVPKIIQKPGRRPNTLHPTSVRKSLPTSHWRSLFIKDDLMKRISQGAISLLILTIMTAGAWAKTIWYHTDKYGTYDIERVEPGTYKITWIPPPELRESSPMASAMFFKVIATKGHTMILQMTKCLLQWRDKGWVTTHIDHTRQFSCLFIRLNAKEWYQDYNGYSERCAAPLTNPHKIQHFEKIFEDWRGK